MNKKHPSSLLTRESQFSHNQQVCFIGGTGKIKDCYFYAGKWIYAIEMPLGPEPEMGRIGAETQIFLEEIEIQEVSEKLEIMNWNKGIDRASKRSSGSRL
ncbi:MAG: hypothetical protein ACRC2R_20960 [Xenococcaceae cyanobacterium]